MELLRDVQVLETGHGLAVGFAGRLLASLGATVTRASGFDPLALAPKGSVQHALHAFLHEGKRKAMVADGPAGIAMALAGCAVWIDARPAATITADRFSEAHRHGEGPAGLTHVTITPFGLDGPWRDKAGSGFVAAAAGGFLYLCGEADREPLRNGGHLPEFQTGLFAALGAVAGLLSTEMGLPGRLVDLSLLEAVIAFQERGDLAVTHLGRDLVRSRRHEGTHPFMVLPCRDGFCTIATGTPRQWEALAILIGKPEWAADPEFALNRLARADEIDAVLLPWLAERTAAEVTEALQGLRIAAGPVLTASQVLDDAHLVERGFFRSLGVAGRDLRVPGFPVRSGGERLDARLLDAVAAEPRRPNGGN